MCEGRPLVLGCCPGKFQTEFRERLGIEPVGAMKGLIPINKAGRP
jgi:hypothetical protein